MWRWQRRFAEAGLDGLLRDATRKPGKAPLGGAVAHRVIALTCAEPPGGATTGPAGPWPDNVRISFRSVLRIWAAHDPQPHRIRTFKRSTDPEFAAKLLLLGANSTPAQARSVPLDCRPADRDPLR